MPVPVPLSAVPPLLWRRTRPAVSTPLIGRGDRANEIIVGGARRGAGTVRALALDEHAAVAAGAREDQEGQAVGRAAGESEGAEPVDLQPSAIAPCASSFFDIDDGVEAD
jgi:hypothetical protein